MQEMTVELKEGSCNSCREKADIDHQIISNRAYQIFLQEGSPAGRTAENWYEAELEFAAAQEEHESLPAMPCGCGHNAIYRKNPF